MEVGPAEDAAGSGNNSFPASFFSGGVSLNIMQKDHRTMRRVSMALYITNSLLIGGNLLFLFLDLIG